MRRHSGLAATLAALLVSSCAVPAQAQAIKCSAFLDEGGGSWRSFFTGEVIGLHGPIAVKTGERLRRGDGGGRGEVAALLDRLCGSP